MTVHDVFPDERDRTKGVYRVRGRNGTVTYRMLGNTLQLEPTDAPASFADQGHADLAFAYATDGHSDHPLWTYLDRWYDTFPEAVRPATVGEWRELRGLELVGAMQRATWYAHESDIGGWSVVPMDVPVSSGIPEVGCFIAEQLARDIVTAHNNQLPASGESL